MKKVLLWGGLSKSHIIHNMLEKTDFTNAAIDHECIVGNGCHFMGSSAVAGRVTIEDYVTVGTNATILPDLKIGTGAFIGAGAVVISDVPSNQVVAGNPAKFLKMNKQEYDISFFNQDS